jgi:ABC-type branched-subunit amino acid transport system permease subunit
VTSSAAAAKSLADITDERQLPLSYLAALIVLFLFIVGERVFYSQVGCALV